VLQLGQKGTAFAGNANTEFNIGEFVCELLHAILRTGVQGDSRHSAASFAQHPPTTQSHARVVYCSGDILQLATAGRFCSKSLRATASSTTVFVWTGIINDISLIKSHNVLLDRLESTAKLADFGLSIEQSTIMASSSGGFSTPVGTPLYMAPQLLNAKKSSTSSDMWAFGILLHELLHGERPLHDTLLPQVQQIVLSGIQWDLEQLHDEQMRGTMRLPKAFSQLIIHCAAKEKTRRATAEYTSNALDHMITEVTGGVMSAFADGFDGEQGSRSVWRPSTTLAHAVRCLL